MTETVSDAPLLHVLIVPVCLSLLLISLVSSPTLLAALVSQDFGVSCLAMID